MKTIYMISFCLDTPNEVHYNPSSPTPSYESVDLGLPSRTLWANMNVGATSMTDCGNYYQYGKGADDYSITSGQSDYSGTENPLALSADTAAQIMGGQWHMPTRAQFEELTENTTYEWTTVNGVNGYKFTAQNGNYVFFPAAGSYYNGSFSDVGTNGRYFASTTYDNYYPHYMSFENGDISISSVDRRLGCSVRGVIGE